MTPGPPRPRVDGFPLLVAAVAAAGAHFGEQQGAGAAHGTLLAATALLGSGLACSGRARVVLVVAAVGVAGSATMQRALDGLERSPLRDAVATRQDVEVRGTLVSDPERGRFSTRARLRVVAFRERPGETADRSVPWRDGGGRHVLVTAGAPTAGEVALLAAGDRVEVEGWLAPLSGWDRRSRWQHAIARLDVTGLIDFRDPSQPLLALANRLRETVLRGLDRLPGDERGLVAAVLIGDTSELSPTTLDEFRAAGLSHLLVVSGSNVAFVLALAAPLLLRLGLTGRLLGGLAIVVVFAAMTRFEPSVLRASVMAALTMVALTLGRPSAPARTLGLTVTALVLIDPFLIHSVAFLLSCAATAGIVALAPALAVRVPGPGALRGVLAVTLAAQIGVAPVLLLTFDSVPLVSLPANLAAVPLAAPLTSWGLAAALTGGVLDSAEPLVAVLQLPTALLARSVLTVARLAARLPLAVDRRAALAGIALAATLGAFVRAWPRATVRGGPLANLRRDGHTPAG